MNVPQETDKKKSEVFRARAKALAREPEAIYPAKAVLEVIEFGLAHERYALEAAYVREVYPLEDLTPLPCTPPFILGLVSVRGRIFPVIDLKKLFDLPDTGIADLHRILIVQTADLEFGILADMIAGVRTLSLEDIQAPLPTLEGIRAAYLKGVTAERVAVLDAGLILADPRIIVHEEVPG